MDDIERLKVAFGLDMLRRVAAADGRVDDREWDWICDDDEPEDEEDDIDDHMRTVRQKILGGCLDKAEYSMTIMFSKEKNAPPMQANPSMSADAAFKFEQDSINKRLLSLRDALVEKMEAGK